MTTRSIVIPSNEYQRERWKNGCGWTRQIYRQPDTEDWAWRLSIAEVDQDGPFSTFEGVERELVLLHGNGMRLEFADGREHMLEPPHGRLRFPGERPLQAGLLDGPTHDFNLMWRRDCIDAQLWLRPLVGPMLFFADPGTTWVVHLVSGQARFDVASGLPPLWMGDTALLRPGAGRSRFALEGGGELLAIKLVERSPDMG